MTTGIIRTLSGNLIDPFNMVASDININDIAHSLSMQCRYNGHVSKFYSVAEHSVLVSQMVPNEYKLWGLLHDATEAYVGDMVSPVKKRLESFRTLEDNIHKVVAERFNLSCNIPELVHTADKDLLQMELKWLETGCREPLHGITGLEPSAAIELFMRTYNTLIIDHHSLMDCAA